MPVNRFAEQFREEAAAAAATTVVPMGFAFLPIFALVQFQPQQQLANSVQDLYRQAYEQAQAKARMARLEKRFFSVWN